MKATTIGAGASAAGVTQRMRVAASHDPTQAQDREQQATEEDLYFAYRLLLGRKPDAAGLQGDLRTIAEQGMTPTDLARLFIASHEFVARNAGTASESSVVEVPLDGFSLFVRSDDRDVGRHIHTARAYEPHVTAAVRNVLRPGHVFIDVGANIGFFTNMAASIVGADGLVLAVEPLDKNRQLLYLSLQRNGFGNVCVHACAAGEREGIASILTDSGTSNGQPLESPQSGPGHFFTQTKKLDDLTADLRRIDVVKFDIDGFELLAWRGFKHMLAKHRPVVLTEFHPYGMRTFVGLDPLDYLDELFAYDAAIDVLCPEGGRIACATPGEVMLRWQQVNEIEQTDGRIHLDLIAQPRH